MSKLWGGRFSKETNILVDEFTSSIEFDKELVVEDINGSMAHVEMLNKCQIISTDDKELIQQGLQQIMEDVKLNKVKFNIENEDIHMNIEKLLIDNIGSVGGKLHTGRSRNDQVATDMHLYLKKKILIIIDLLNNVQKTILNKSIENFDVIFPGYTHLQRAQPILFSHHLLAYFWMLERDKERFQESLKRVDISPLGTGALAGTTFPIDRQLTANILKFASIYPNSMDAVSDRDYIVEFMSNASLLMMHISRLSEELIIWASQEFQFIELDDSFCTGSSIMPQKKNPDVPELLRAKTGRVYGNLIGLLTVLKGLPLAYNKDMQEDKEGMFDTVKTLEMSLKILEPMLDTMKVNSEVMERKVKEDYSNATDIADYLVNKGLTFRESHELTGKIVLYAITNKLFLLDVPLSEYKSFSPLFEQDIYKVLEPENVVNLRNSYGGTAKEQVIEQINLAKMKIK